MAEAGETGAAAGVIAGSFSFFRKITEEGAKVGLPPLFTDGYLTVQIPLYPLQRATVPERYDTARN